MNPAKATLFMPVENQVRELDSKLLLACIAAKRGFSSVIGSRREMHIHISSFPRGIYLAKSLPVHRNIIFKIMRKLGHEIVAWDEEALVHPQAETYYRRRVCPLGLRYVSHLFAWGEDNAKLWRQYPELPIGMPIHVTGNPRGDLLRPKMCALFEKDAEELRKTYGDFILVNTNFNHINAFSPDLNLFRPAKKPGEEPSFGRAARGMSRDYAEGLRDHKQDIFEEFQQLIPALEQAFPDYNIVVRPHPTEDPHIYHDIAAQCERVQVTNEGNVVPWLVATRALIHNSCTTLLSHECFDFKELRVTLERILTGELGTADGDERKALIDQYLTAQDGPLACERMVDVLEGMMEGRFELPRPSLSDRLAGWSMSTIRTLIKRAKERLPGSHNRPEFQRHRYPEVTLEEIRARLSRFQQVLGDSKELKVEQISQQFFEISG